MRLIFATLYQRFKQRIYMMLNYATLYQRFKQRIYIMLNYALIQVIGYLKQLALRVYIVHCLSRTKHMITNAKCVLRREEKCVSVM